RINNNINSNHNNNPARKNKNNNKSNNPPRKNDNKPRNDHEVGLPKPISLRWESVP
ncbi:hypothetical protein A2U01_0097824, partial [Trifolium medium]|nr:hypothetical protein [Trifolium medium]